MSHFNEYDLVNLFYLFLVSFEICGLKEDVRLVIRKKYEEPIVLKMPKWAWHGLMWLMWEVRGGGSLPFMIPCLFLSGVLVC